MDKGLDFAKEELSKYLLKMGYEGPVQIDTYCDETLINEFDKGEKTFSPDWDDAYIIEIVKAEGRIVGTNGRSVLLGVYQFLNELGCCFFRPSEDGEYIPLVDKDKINCSLKKLASYRHRGICIEGAVSLEHVIEMIEWAPKNGFNSYFIQFREGHTFFERWYQHKGNDTLPEEKFTREDSAKFLPVIINEIKKRGMLFHAVGHGWTCECLGYPSAGWDIVDNDTIPDDKRQFLAQVNEKREFYEGVPLNTHLCYSNEVVREKMIHEIVDYIKQHNEIDVLHFWLADNFNNFCECDECRKDSPTDQYIKLLNDLDEKLTLLNITTKIVFLIYFELLWTPKNQVIKNPDRFIMMFAPITRTYTKAYLENGLLPDEKDIKCMEFDLNKMKYPTEIAGNLAFLFEWQKVFKGDSFDFDYHLMWDIYKDYSNMRLSKIIYEDIVGLKKLGLNGNVSCQVQRAFFPNGICMYIMGKTLFDSSIPYETLVNDYFRSSYGEFSNLAKEYLQGIADYIPHEYMRNEIPMIDQLTAKKFESGFQFVKDSIILLNEAENKMQGNQRSMMHILSISALVFKDLFYIFYEKASGVEIDILKEKWSDLNKKTCGLELELSSVLDMFYFNMITKGIIETTW